MTNYPIVKVPDLGARINLINALEARGWKGHGPAGDCAFEGPYVMVYLVGNRQRNGVASEHTLLKYPVDKPGAWSHPMIMMNSPAHMLAYLARHAPPPF